MYVHVFRSVTSGTVTGLDRWPGSATIRRISAARQSMVNENITGILWGMSFAIALIGLWFGRRRLAVAIPAVLVFLLLAAISLRSQSI
jgi:hypothetical protein